MSTQGIAELAFTGGNIITVDENFSIAEALAVSAGKFVVVGTDDQVKPYIGKDTTVIELEGKTVIPGITDSHMHIGALGQALAQVPLFEVFSIAEIIRRLKERLPQAPGDQYLFGKGETWHPRQMEEGRLPDRDDLDRVSTDVPVLIGDVNKLIVNSKVLELAGITKSTGAPDGGRIDRNPETSEPTGAFWVTARNLIWQAMPRVEKRPQEHLKLASDACIKVGITALVDAHTRAEEIKAFREVENAGKLKLRVRAMPLLPLDARPNEVDQLRTQLEDDDGKLRVGPMKLFFDGGVMWRTAYMYEPFHGEPGNFGSTRVEAQKLKARIFELHQRGWSTGIHCTGDHALELATGFQAEAIKRWPDTNTRHFAIHGYFPTEKTLETMRQVRIPAAVQPRFLYAWGETMVDYIGLERASRFKPLRTYLDTGIILAGGSDAAVVSYNPFLGMEAAVTRRTASGRVLGTEEVVSVEEILRAYTMGSAYITFEENVRGSIKVGKLAATDKAVGIGLLPDLKDLLYNLCTGGLSQCGELLKAVHGVPA